jgi:hypothetical protein
MTLHVQAAGRSCVRVAFRCLTVHDDISHSSQWLHKLNRLVSPGAGTGACGLQDCSSSFKRGLIQGCCADTLSTSTLTSLMTRHTKCALQSRSYSSGVSDFLTVKSTHQPPLNTPSACAYHPALHWTHTGEPAEPPHWSVGSSHACCTH